MRHITVKMMGLLLIMLVMGAMVFGSGSKESEKSSRTGISAVFLVGK